jgi:hypothetical protein
MNIAPRVIATIRAVVKTDARIIFMMMARRIEAAGRRITQLGANQNERVKTERLFRGSA